MEKRKVVTIPPTVNRFTASPMSAPKKRKVAAYAWVSTDSDEQFTSYAAQIDYYTQFIKARDDWEFISVYTDEERSYPGLLVKNLPPCKKVGLTYENYLMIGVNSSKFARCIQLVGKGL